MRFKILLLISPLLALTTTLFAKPVFDSVGVENQNGKKVILHKIEPKDTYYAVGRRYDVKPNLIIQFNNNLVLHPGAVIKVPTDIPFDGAKPVAQAPVKKVEERNSVQQYKVSAGETLYSIARRFNTTVDNVKADNNLKSDVLSPGELLTIKTVGNTPAKAPEKPAVAEAKPTPPPVVQQKPQVQPPVAAPAANTVAQQTQNTPVSTQNTQQYKVSAGETLYAVAKRFNTSVDDIIALNKLNGNTITPGQVLTVRSGMPPASVPAVPKPQAQEAIAKRDTIATAIGDSADRHLPANRYGLFVKEEKGPATVVKITNPMTNRTTYAKVVGRFTDNEANKDVILVVTKNVAESLGAMDKRFRVNISYGVQNNDQ
jgi:LysM repeat protein